MNIKKRNAMAGVLIVTMTGGVGALAASQASGDLKEIASYRLTLDGLRKVEVATRAMVEGMKKDPRFQAAMKLGAEIEALEKKDNLTEAEERRLDELQEERERLEEELNPLEGAQSLSQMEAALKRFPPMADGLKQAGISAREYATFTMAMVQAVMAASLKQGGVIKELPPDVSAENVKFVIDHEAELKAMQEELERIGKS